MSPKESPRGKLHHLSHQSHAGMISMVQWTGMCLGGSTSRSIVALLFLLVSALAGSAFFTHVLHEGQQMGVASSNVKEMRELFRESGQVLGKMKNLAEDVLSQLQQPQSNQGGGQISKAMDEIEKMTAHFQQLEAAIKSAHQESISLQEALLQNLWSPTLPDKGEKLKGCVLFSDTRNLKEEDEYVDKSYDYLEVNGLRLPGWLSSKFVNRAYARRHGYLFLDTADETYPTDRHPSWFKIKFIRDKLACCCKWAFFLDSDAYFRMDNHRLSVEDWVKSLGYKNHFEYIPEHFNVDLINQTWLPHAPERFLSGSEKEAKMVALIPRSGAHPFGYWGKPGDLFRPVGYMNAGVMLWRRSARALKILDEWYNVPEGDPMLNSHPWEQSWLNRLGVKHKHSIGILPYFELTGPNGSFVRHIWSDVRLERQARLHLSVLGLVASQEITSYKECL